jgi:cell division septation protein DedD
MNLKSSILIIFTVMIFKPFLWAQNGPPAIDSLNMGIDSQSDSSITETAPQADSLNRETASQADSANMGIATQPQPTPRDSGAVRSEPKKKMVYLVCAARYSSRSNAEKHIESLKQFGYAPWIQVKGESIFLVVLGKTDERPKAEKMKSNYEKRGLTSFIEES